MGDHRLRDLWLSAKAQAEHAEDVDDIQREQADTDCCRTAHVMRAGRCWTHRSPALPRQTREWFR